MTTAHNLRCTAYDRIDRQDYHARILPFLLRQELLNELIISWFVPQVAEGSTVAARYAIVDDAQTGAVVLVCMNSCNSRNWWCMTTADIAKDDESVSDRVTAAIHLLIDDYLVHQPLDIMQGLTSSSYATGMCLYQRLQSQYTAWSEQYDIKLTRQGCYQLQEECIPADQKLLSNESLRRATMQDLPLITQYMTGLTTDTWGRGRSQPSELSDPSSAAYQEQLQRMTTAATSNIQTSSMWIMYISTSDGEQTPVGMSFVRILPELLIGRFSGVYTPPEHRQRGYQRRAIPTVTRMMMTGKLDDGSSVYESDGVTAMTPCRLMSLHTDLDYEPSNALYVKSGFRLINAGMHIMGHPK